MQHRLTSKAVYVFDMSLNILLFKIFKSFYYWELLIHLLFFEKSITTRLEILRLLKFQSIHVKKFINL